MSQSTSDPALAQIRIEHQPVALGITNPQPRLSWRIETVRYDWIQAAYQIQLLGEDGKLRADTGKISSAESVLVKWPFAPLNSREVVTVRARVWGSDGSESGWSAPTPIEMGLLQPTDWSAKFVRPAWYENTSHPNPVPLLRREFSIKPGLQSARLYVTALGVYEAQINGNPVGDHVLAPGWTKYDHQLHYQTFDVTPLLREGTNAIGAMLGDGWFRGRLGFGDGRRNIYGDRVALLAQLELTYADGGSQRIVTDEQWRTAHGPIQLSGIYEGENYDARLERNGWSQPGYDAQDWSEAVELPHDLSTLVAPPGPPVRRTQTVKPVSIFKSPSGKTLVDFGQNLVGRLRIKVRGAAGTTITLRHAEVIEKGELGTRPLRRAECTDRYTLRGGGLETYEPHFTFHGFRYAEVSGWPGTLFADDLEAVVIHSDLERAGWFDCSNALINRLHDNVLWSMRGNFLSIPTDCPQRDERLGWTGDIQVFAPTATFLYHVNGFLQSWLSDLAAEQRQYNGVVPVVVPFMLSWPNRPQAAWGDAATIVPTVLHQRYGDEQILDAQFDSMCNWVDLLEKHCGENLLWNYGFQLGDWLDPAAPPDKPSKAQTSAHLVATACFARSADLTSQAARVLGQADAAARYATLGQRIRHAFLAEHVTPSGRMMNDAQTAYAIALAWDLLPQKEQREHAGERLAAIARENSFHIGTGFVGTPVICDALTLADKTSTAYAMLTQTTNPSWLYPVSMGATTIWERWDSMLPDGSINPGEMTSFNHYALGAVADWMHRIVAGLAPAAPGYKRILFAPQPGGGLTHANARHISPYGAVECGWTLRDGLMEVQVVVPPNTLAEVRLPGRESEQIEVGSGAHGWTYVYAVAGPGQPLTLDSTLAEFRREPRLWSWLSANMQPALKDHIHTQNILQDDDRSTLRQAMQGARNLDAALVTIGDGLRKVQTE